MDSACFPPFVGYFDHFYWVEKPIYTQDVVIFTFPVPISCGLGDFLACICICRRVALINQGLSPKTLTFNQRINLFVTKKISLSFLLKADFYRFTVGF